MKSSRSGTTASAPSDSSSSTRWLFAAGGKFNQDLADNADTGLFLVCDRDTVKVFNYFTAHFAEGEVVRKLFRGQEILALFIHF